VKSKYNSHVIRIALGLVVFAAIGFIGKTALTPDSFGKYGHYRADAVMEEANREIRIWTNASCLGCHKYEAQLHLSGKHRTISCEFCHGPYADHIKDGKKVAALPVKKGDDIKILCLRCHNKAIHARPKDIIKTVTMPDHLKEQKVKLTHLCVQCHHQHAPLKYIIRAEQMLGMQEKT
jgi:hypothetical protein